MTQTPFEFIQANCLDWMSKQPEKSIQCIVTSPPYNLNIKYGQYKDNHEYTDYLNWIGSIAVAMNRVLADDGHIFLNVGYSNVQPWVAIDVAQMFRSKSWVLQNQITWVKHILLNEQSYGIFKPIAGNRFVSPTTENIFHFTKTGEVPIDRLAIGHRNQTHAQYPELYTEGRHIANLRRRAVKRLGYSTWIEFQKKATPEHQQQFATLMEAYQEEHPWDPDKKICIGNTWYIPYTPVSKLAKELGSETLGDKKTGRGNHPATFPEQLPAMCIKLSGIPKGSLVYDPFSGTGTTVLAAVKLGMHGIGTDIDPEYLEFSEERLWSWEKTNINLY